MEKDPSKKMEVKIHEKNNEYLELQVWYYFVSFEKDKTLEVVNDTRKEILNMF